MGPNCSQVSQLTSPGITGADGRGSCVHSAAGIPLPGPLMARACQRGPPTAKEEKNGINNLDSTS